MYRNCRRRETCPGRDDALRLALYGEVARLPALPETWVANRNDLISRDPGQQAFRDGTCPTIAGALSGWGVIPLIPPQKYVEAVSKESCNGSFLAFLPKSILYGSRNFCTSDLFGSWGYHLWFLVYLFVFSPALLPPVRLLQTGGGRRVLDAVTTLLAGKRMLLMTALPIMAVYVTIKPMAPRLKHFSPCCFSLMRHTPRDLP